MDSRLGLHLQQVEQKLLALLRSARDIGLPREQLGDMISLTEVGEPGIALECFCEQVYEHDLWVPDSILVGIVELRTAMGVDERYWSPLKRSPS